MFTFALHSSFSLLRPHLFGICLLAAAFASYANSDDDDAPISTEHTLESQSLSDNTSQKLSVNIQKISGINTEKLQPSTYQPEFRASANVLELASLLLLREQYFAAQTDYQAAKASLTAAEQNSKRVQDLFQNGVNSEHQLQEQQMQLGVNNARVANSEFRLQSLRENLTANWGEVLSSWVRENTNANMHALINRQTVLLLLSLPANQTLPANIKQVFVDPEGNRQQAQTAQFVAPAPQSSHLTQGETYFFKAARGKLRTGMHLSVWINAAENKLSGYLVPSSALIWHAGQAGIFLKTNSENFERHVLKSYFPQSQGYFIADALPTESEVVTTGAQLLLSQEFRSHIQKEEDGD